MPIQLTPVDGNPFEQQAAQSGGVTLTPVEGNPFGEEQHDDLPLTGAEMGLPPAFVDRVHRGQAVANAMADPQTGPSMLSRAGQSLKTIWEAAKEGGAAGLDAKGLAEQWARQRAELANVPDYFGGYRLLESGVEASESFYHLLNAAIMGAGAAVGQGVSMAMGQNEADQARARRDFAQMFMIGGVAAGGEPSPLMVARDGKVARLTKDADGNVQATVVGGPPTPAAFDNAAEAIARPKEQDQFTNLEGHMANRMLNESIPTEQAKQATAAQTGSGTSFPPANENKIGVVKSNLERLWQDQGIHPAEAAHDAQSDAFLRHDLTTKGEEVKPDKTMIDNWPEPVPRSLGAAVNDMPEAVPLSEQPAPQPGRLTAALKETGDKLLDMGRDAQMLVAPMATGTRDSMAIAKDFANTMRRNRWEWSRIDDDIAKRFTPEQRERMWNAADEESVLRQEGQTSEHIGLATLEPEERAAVEDLQSRAQIAWGRARDLGMVEGEGLPAYTPRMIINAARNTSGEGAIPLNGIGLNLKTKTAGMRSRKYLTAEETEAAAKQALGSGAEIARDIRVLPIATARLEDAVAGRTLINNIRDYGKQTGTETVVEGGIPAGSDTKWFTLDHPAFRTWRPKFREGQDSKVEAVKDADGNTIFEQVPLYVHGDFEGPLKAVLTQRSGALYAGLMSLKGKTMSLIMNSPLIHNAVEWGRALPAMPGKVATFKIYFEGNRAKNDIALMREAIDNGLVPIGHRFFNQDISSIMEQPDLTPGRSWTAKILGAVPDLFDPAAGAAVKRAIDKAGDFWHNTLLWDRVGDLQAGLYRNFLDDLLAKGVDRTTASRAAAHFANRYAGSLPQEAMSDGARKIANMLLFSRTFTLGNLGAMKDMLTGLPKDVLAQIERDAGFRAGAINEAGELAGPEVDAVKYAKTMARRKAMSVVAMDIAMFYVANSVLQSSMNVMFNDSTLDKEMHGYVERLKQALTRVRENPLSLIQPFNFFQGISATGDNEPGRQDRALVGYAKDGTAIYARNPAGKIGEEFIGWMTGPLDMLRRKLGTIARPVWQILSNDKGFGRKIYDPDADTPAKYLANLGRIVEHIVGSQLPTGQLGAIHDLVTGEGDKKVNLLQAFGPLAGVTFSKGAPGGPAVGELYHAREQHDYAVQAELPDIRKQILRGDLIGARERMTQLGIPPGLQRFYLRTTINPATRLSGRTLRDFYRYATPEQRQRLEALRAH